jgi:hypothetical protein
MYPDSDVVVDLFMSQAIRKLCFKTSSLSCKFGSLTLQLVTKVRSILFSVVLSATVCTKIAHDFSLFWVMLDLWYALMQWMDLFDGTAAIPSQKKEHIGYLCISI